MFKDITESPKVKNVIVQSGDYATEQEFVNRIEDIFRQCLQKFPGLLSNRDYEETRTIIEQFLNRIVSDDLDFARVLSQD